MQLRLELSPKQVQAFKHLNDPSVREVLFGGGKNGGKSYLGISWIFPSAMMYPGTHYFIARRELIDLRKYTVPSIMEWYSINKIDPAQHFSFNAQDSMFIFSNGSRVYLISCKAEPNDPMFERFGSMQMTQGWIEEGSEIDENAYENLKLSIGRWRNDQYNLAFKLLITCNPKKNWLYTGFYIPHRDGHLHPSKRLVKSLVTDNVFRQSNAEETLNNIRDNATRQRLRYGDWEYVDDSSVLIPYDSAMSLFTNAHVKPTGVRYITCDVARFGVDKTVIRVWDGLVCIERASMEKVSTQVTADKIKQLSSQFNVATPNILIDEDGVGGGVVDMVPGSKGFIANKAPIKVNEAAGVNYDNLKTQCVYKLSELINGYQIADRVSDKSSGPLLVDELTAFKEKNVDRDGKRSIIGKDKMKQALGRSPDDGDTYVMRMMFELLKNPFVFKFDPVKHVGTTFCELNRNMFISVHGGHCLVGQYRHSDKIVMIVDEIAGNYHEIVDALLSRYGDYVKLGLVILTGEVTKEVQDILYIRGKLQLTNGRIKLQASSDMRAMLNNTFDRVSVTIDTSCSLLIGQLGWAQSDQSGQVVNKNSCQSLFCLKFIFDVMLPSHIKTSYNYSQNIKK